MGQGIRRKGRLSHRVHNVMFYTGVAMLCVYYGLHWRHMESEDFLVRFFALSMSTVVGTVAGYFLIRSNVAALLVSSGCASILLLIAHCLIHRATIEEFIMWWQLAIFECFMQSFVATLVAFPALDTLIAHGYPARNKSEP